MSYQAFSGRKVEGYAVLGQAAIAISDDMSKISTWDGSAADSLQRKTKLICTMGPSCWDVDTLIKMIDQGLNIARFNFSHGDFETHANTLKNLRTALKQRPGKEVA
ncbi:hypothetical protein FOZ63_010337, partial [Perkinsus olseni]